MRIAQLSTSRVGGAGLASLRYSEALKSVGVENDLFALNNFSVTHNLTTNPITRTSIEIIKSKSLTYLQSKFIQYGSDLITPISLQPNSLDKIISKYDLVHLHSTYNILDHKGLTSLVDSGKKIVITLHDQRWFTGGCHYSLDCRGFLGNCTDCPQATSLGKIFVENSFMKLHKIISRNQQIKIISPSKWLADYANDSKILNGQRIKVIRNPIPTFNPSFYDSVEARRNQVTNKSKSIVFVSDNLQNPLKGLSILLEALQLLKPSELNHFQLILIGNNPPDLSELPFRTTVAKVYTTKELWLKIKEADALVVPSIQDNLPNVIGEAFSVGLKVIGSNIGGIPEVITPSNGFLFEKNNARQLAEILSNFDTNYSKEQIISYFESNFQYNHVGKLINDFYKE